jgi:hypothetical protein
LGVVPTKRRLKAEPPRGRQGSDASCGGTAPRLLIRE